ncbi:MAG: hypothetical protein ACLTQI_00895 [Slackia sp.]
MAGDYVFFRLSSQADASGLFSCWALLEEMGIEGRAASSSFEVMVGYASRINCWSLIP